MAMSFEQAVKECRRLGVLQFKCPEFEFVVGPEPAPAEAVDNNSEKVKSPAKKRGKDGYTAEEQREVYGVVIDAEE